MLNKNTVNTNSTNATKMEVCRKVISNIWIRVSHNFKEVNKAIEYWMFRTWSGRIMVGLSIAYMMIKYTSITCQ